MTVLALRDDQAAAAIPAKLHYAKALAESGLLPASYRKNPANVLWAMEYGSMLGLAPMATMTGVHVIEGKPTASAGLISALVRQAGHKLRVDGDNKSATCVITRSDDPKPFSVTWTLKKDGSNPSAEEAKLLSKPVWQQYPASMLKSRAITQCARDACEEVLFGLHYTPEELGADVDEDGAIVDEPPQRPADRANGTPPDDQWYVRPAPEPAADDGRPWAEVALELAGTCKTEAEGNKLWREAAARHRAGECTRDEADHIQSLVVARIKARRREASDMALRLLPESAADWKAAVEGLNGDDIETCRESLEEVGRLKAAGTMDEILAGRIAGAIIALCPKAAVDPAGDDGA